MENESGLHVTGDLVLVKPPEVAEMTAGGIVLSKITQEKEGFAARYGVLVDAGESAWHHPRLVGIKPGDTILFARYSGDFFPRNDVKYAILRADSVLGRLDDGVVPDYALNAARASTEVFKPNADPVIATAR